MAWPMPRAAPVTRLTLPDKSQRILESPVVSFSGNSHGLGFSIKRPSDCRKRAAGAPSTIRWSNVRRKHHPIAGHELVVLDDNLVLDSTQAQDGTLGQIDQAA